MYGEIFVGYGEGYGGIRFSGEETEGFVEKEKRRENVKTWSFLIGRFSRMILFDGRRRVGKGSVI